MKFCKYHNEEHEESRFRVVNKATGALDSWCRDARAERAKQRYDEKKGLTPTALPERTLFIETARICSSCETKKPIMHFPLRPDRPGKRYAKCEPCLKAWRAERNAASYERHQEDRIQRARDYRERNPEKSRESARKQAAKQRSSWSPERKLAFNEYYRLWGKENRVKRRDIERRYREANRDKIRAKNRRRASKRRGAPGSCTYDQQKARWDLYGGLCWMCGALATSIDHVKPIEAGGSEFAANLRPACRSCNSSKGQKWPFPTTRR